MNQALLAKWLWKLEKENDLWQKVIKKNYLPNGCVSAVKHRPETPNFGLEFQGLKIPFINTVRRLWGKILGFGRLVG